MILKRVLLLFPVLSLFAVVNCYPASAQTNGDGVPIGGIGAGSIQILKDGSISRATINNNWRRPTGVLRGSFGAVSVRVGSASVGKVISAVSAYGLPTTSNLVFDGSFPEVTFHSPADNLMGVEVTVRAFSSFIPGDIRSSSFPAATFVFHLVNHSTNIVSCSAALAFENTLGVGNTPSGTAFSNRTGDRVAPIPDSEGFFGLQFSSARDANGASADKEHDGASGEMCLLTRPDRSAAQVTAAAWNALASTPTWWDEFTQKGTVSGECSAGVEGSIHPDGVVAVKLQLKPRESADIPVCIAWYTPILRGGADLADYGHYYQVAFKNSQHVARTLLGDWQSFLGLTEEWQKRISFSSLPNDLQRRLLNSVAPLVTSSLHVKDGRFTLLPEVNDDIAIGQATRSYLRERRRAADLVKCLFPQLAAQELVQLTEVRRDDGSFPVDCSDWAARIGPADPVREPDDTPDGYPQELMLSSKSVSKSGSEHSTISIASALDTVEFVLQTDRLAAEGGSSSFLQHTIETIHDCIGEVAAIHQERSLTDADLLRWRLALIAAKRLSASAVTREFEWGSRASALENAVNGMFEVGHEEAFQRSCDTILKACLAEIERRRVQIPTDTLVYNNPSLAGDVQRTGLSVSEDWSILRGIEGFSLDQQTGYLNLTTPIPGTWRSLAAPIFAPAFVGKLEFSPTAHGGKLTLRIDRTISVTPVRSFRKRVGASGATQLTLKQLRIAGPPPSSASVNNRISQAAPEVHVSLGSHPVGCTTRVEPSGQLTLEFSSPLVILTGDILQVEVH